MQLFDSVFSEIRVPLKGGKQMVPTTIKKEGDRLFLNFPFHDDLREEVKTMETARWHGRDERNPRKEWSVRDSQRNRFRLQYLANPASNNSDNPYLRYNCPLLEVATKRDVYKHQGRLVRHGLTRHYGIWAAEMGTGKTLAAIEVMELSNMEDWIWVGTRNALVGARLEFRKWGAKITPTYVTYEGLQKLLSQWPKGRRAPMGVIFDECSRCKNPTAKRTQAARYLADAVRSEWGERGYVIMMSGSPAPKSPADWWSLCEIACPGFLREGDINKFKNRLAIIEQREQFVGGGVYPHLVTWRDNSKKCNICGLMREAETHESGVDVFQTSQYLHEYVPSVNEVELLYQRMGGLVEVIFKKDCLDLPDKIYREVICKPTRSILNAAYAIQGKAGTAMECMVLLRELSDGFQYLDQVQGEETCPVCKGNKSTLQPVYPEEVSEDEKQTGEYEPTFEERACERCSGSGIIGKVVTITKQLPCPKEDALKDILEEHEDVGRIVIYAGFQGSVDRIVKICQSQQWKIIRVDGRGWITDIPGLTKDENMVECFQSEQEKHPRIAFCAHPQSGGMSLTLTASPTIVYYSNDYNAENRAQSEDRIHRPGMDVNRGATIIDLFHLPTDRKVVNNLKGKLDLQKMTMGDIKECLEEGYTKVPNG
jgi:hypothetical protein